MTYPVGRLKLQNTFGQKKALAGKKWLKNKPDNMTINSVRKFTNKYRPTLRRKIKLTDSSTYQVEIAQFQDLILQKENARFSYWLHGQHA